MLPELVAVAGPVGDGGPPKREKLPFESAGDPHSECGEPLSASAKSSLGWRVVPGVAFAGGLCEPAGSASATDPAY